MAFSACKHGLRKDVIDRHWKNKHPNKSLDGKLKWKPILISGQGSLFKLGFQSSKPVEDDTQEKAIDDIEDMSGDGTEDMADDGIEEIGAGKRDCDENENFPNKKVKRTETSNVENKVDKEWTKVI